MAVESSLSFMLVSLVAPLDRETDRGTHRERDIQSLEAVTAGMLLSTLWLMAAVVALCAAASSRGSHIQDRAMV